MKKIEKILWGIFLIILGVILGLNVLEITDIDIFFDGWWAFILIIPCFIGLFGNDNKLTNIIGIALGLVLFLSSQDIINFKFIWKLSIPVLFIIIGLYIIFKDNDKINNIKTNTQSCENITYSNTFSSKSYVFDNQEIKNCSMCSTFGDGLYDLRKAQFTTDININTSATFGKIKIFVPNNINIVINKTSPFSIITNKSNIFTSVDSKTIYINDSSVFGKVTIL